MPQIQEKRDKVVVPNGLPLHRYANLYFHARNVMLYVRRSKHKSLIVLQIKTDVLDLPNVVIADGNASSEYTAFYPSPDGLDVLNSELVFAEIWTHPDLIEKWKRTRARCAEVLIPEKVRPDNILGVYVSCEESKMEVESIVGNLPVIIDSHLFFQASIGDTND